MTRRAVGALAVGALHLVAAPAPSHLPAPHRGLPLAPHSAPPPRFQVDGPQLVEVATAAVVGRPGEVCSLHLLPPHQHHTHVQHVAEQTRTMTCTPSPRSAQHPGGALALVLHRNNLAALALAHRGGLWSPPRASPRHTTEPCNRQGVGGAFEGVLLWDAPAGGLLVGALPAFLLGSSRINSRVAIGAQHSSSQPPCNRSSNRSSTKASCLAHLARSLAGAAVLHPPKLLPWTPVHTTAATAALLLVEASSKVASKRSTKRPTNRTATSRKQLHTRQPRGDVGALVGACSRGGGGRVAARAAEQRPLCIGGAVAGRVEGDVGVFPCSSGRWTMPWTMPWRHLTTWTHMTAKTLRRRWTLSTMRRKCARRWQRRRPLSVVERALGRVGGALVAGVGGVTGAALPVVVGELQWGEGGGEVQLLRQVRLIPHAHPWLWCSVPRLCRVYAAVLFGLFRACSCVFCGVFNAFLVHYFLYFW